MSYSRVQIKSQWDTPTLHYSFYLSPAVAATPPNQQVLSVLTLAMNQETIYS